MGSLGAPELLIIGVVLVLLFGATRLPQTAKGLAQSLRVFRQELRDDDSERPQAGALPQAPRPEAQAPQAQPVPQAQPTPQAQPAPQQAQETAAEPFQPHPSN